MNEPTLLMEGRNCWRKAHSQRLAFLIDAAAYFSAFKVAVRKARRSVFIVGWDIHSELTLERDHPDPRVPNRLAELLDALAAERPELNVYILTWNPPLIYMPDHELLTTYRLGWLSHERVHFRLDDVHPVGACHHQKIVVIDDTIAFVGGIDLTARRWDTPDHRPDDPRRTDPDGKRFAPVHDVQVALDGEAAAALGELVRGRWERAAGRALHPARAVGIGDPWPENLRPDIQNVSVAIARTEVPLDSGRPIREIETLYLDFIAAARRSIYIESQYFTAESVVAALAERLKEQDGPEVIVVLPKICLPLLEQAAMDVPRARVLRRLREADAENRLRVYYPEIPGLSEEDRITIHAKLMVVDDRFVRVGSANLNNRSMGVDTECDVAIEAMDEPGIGLFRDRLIAEHLGVSPDRVAAAIADAGSLIRGIERLQNGGRTLRPLEDCAPDLPEIIESVLPEATLLDPKEPIEAETLTSRIVKEAGPEAVIGRISAMAIPLALAVALALAWRFTPLQEWLVPEKLLDRWNAYRDLPLSGLFVIGGFIVGGAVMIPVTVMIAATGLAFGPIFGFVYALGGALTSALAIYGLGRILGRRWGRALFRTRVDRVLRLLSRQGVLAVALVRWVPVAPFAAVNFLAGAARVRLRDFGLGTAFGMAPGIAVLTLFGDRLGATLRDPAFENILALTGLTLTLLLIVGVATNRIRKRFRSLITSTTGEMTSVSSRHG